VGSHEPTNHRKSSMSRRAEKGIVCGGGITVGGKGCWRRTGKSSLGVIMNRDGKGKRGGPRITHRGAEPQKGLDEWIWGG